MKDFRHYSEGQRIQTMHELRRRLADLSALQFATDLMYLELLPPSEAGPIGSPTCPLCGRSTLHEHNADEQVIFRNGIRFGKQAALAARDAEIVKLRERPMQTDLDQANEVIAARDARIQELTEQYFSYREAAGASIGADVNQQAIDRILQLEKALGEIRGCAWIDKHGLERYNLLKIESILNDAIGPPKDRTSGDGGKG